MDEQFIKDFTRTCVDRWYYITPSAVASKIEYIGVDTKGWRFEKIRAIAEQEIKIYKQHEK